ncbi:hypothetical protein AXG93_3671s1310 [Marchantia polymorpha subsp. ruderalis]|uniref:Uncharacterized protein n=1 Tax=Marchantia polymorpha subsp. ruderalis TaxID=1480154 RepID=A0A176WJ86_MARPO|nr:hypothetical protein AXG93_3671s1310 [Marchantia polymorpha subsp. ruderalis]
MVSRTPPKVRKLVPLKEALVNHLTPYIVNFNQGVGLLTKEEEKRFSKEREILAIESSKKTEEEDNVQPEVPPKSTTRGLVQESGSQGFEAMPKKKANRGSVVSDSLDSSVAKTDVAALTTDEEKNDEPTLQALEEGPSVIPTEVVLEVVVDPYEE